MDRPALRPRRLRLVVPGRRRAARRRRLLRPALPRQGADGPPRRRPRPPAVRYQGNWIPHRSAPAAEDGVFFVGDSAGHCLPMTAEGIRTALYFGIACGRELAPVLEGERTREDALRATPPSRGAPLEVRVDEALPGHGCACAAGRGRVARLTHRRAAAGPSATTCASPRRSSRCPRPRRRCRAMSVAA